MIRRDPLIATLIAGGAFALYVATLQPGLGGPEDTPKFQFLGHVLGTAHPPGYPLYVLLTHIFVQLPIGTIAYRANLFSGLMAALACGAAYILGRQIGAGRWAAACCALALATGLGFWNSAVYAEVYSLAAFICVMTVALLVSWGTRHGTAWLLGAVGTFGLGLGNHLTIVGLVPAGAWFILVRHRKALSPRLILACLAVLLLAVSQYWFIVVRSRQATTYLESRATSISQLAGVITAQRFANERFAFGPKALITTQIPAVSSAVRLEMGTLGVLLLGAGFAAAIWRRNTAAILVLASAAGLFGMVINIAGDIRGFITPVIVLLWPVAALGIQTIAELSSRRAIARAAVLAAATLLPLSSVATNYQPSDHSHDTEDARFFEAIFKQLPETSEVVMENYWYAMMINYLSFTGETGRPGGLWQLDSRAPTIRKAKSDGRRVFAFAGAATYLSAEGLQFQRATLEGPSLNEWLRELPRSSLVVGAAANTPVPIEALPIDRTRAPSVGSFHPFGTFAWIAGERDAILEMHDVKASLTRGTIIASAERDGARIELDGHTLAEIDEGIVLAAFTPFGEVLRILEFRPGETLRVPFRGALYELSGDSPCVDVTPSGWSDITPIVVLGSWVTALDVYGVVTIETEFSGASDIRTRTSALMGTGTIRTVGQTQHTDGTTAVLTELGRSGFQRTLFRLSLDRRPIAARARLKPGGAVASMKLCADEPPPLFARERGRAVLRPDFESEPFFGPGWSGPQRNGAVTFRQSVGDTSTLLLPLDAGADYRVTSNIDADTGTALSFLANQNNVGTCVVATTTPCEVTLPRGALRDGVNWVTMMISRPARGAQRPAALTFRGARIHRLE